MNHRFTASLVQERTYVQDKINEYKRLIHSAGFHSLDVDEQQRIKQQVELMEQLESVLSVRIEHRLEKAA